MFSVDDKVKLISIRHVKNVDMLGAIGVVVDNHYDECGRILVNFPLHIDFTDNSNIWCVYPTQLEKVNEVRNMNISKDRLKQLHNIAKDMDIEQFQILGLMIQSICAQHMYVDLITDGEMQYDQRIVSVDRDTVVDILSEMMCANELSHVDKQYNITSRYKVDTGIAIPASIIKTEW